MHKSRLAFLTLALLLLGMLALTTTLSAAVVKHFTLKDLSETATVIVHAKVDSSSAAWNNERTKIWTSNALTLTETLKGSFDGNPTCDTRGGSVNRKEQAVAGEARLSVGSEYLLFLWRDDDGRYRCVGMAQGAFLITREEGKDATAANTLRGIQVVNAAGGQMAEKVVAISGKLSDLITSIKGFVPAPEAEDKKADSEAAKDAAKDAAKVTAKETAKKEGE